MPEHAPRASLPAIFLAFLRLGLISFGGPIAHLGFFREEFVGRRRWLDENTYADLVALCQFLPGPASSQVGIALGISQAGLRGGFAAWLGFTLPSAVLMALFGLGVVAYGGVLDAGWLQGLKLVALAVVAQAVWAMAKGLLTGRVQIAVALFAMLAALYWPHAGGQLLVIVAAALSGWILLPAVPRVATATVQFPVGRRTGILAWVIFFSLLAGLPLLTGLSAACELAMFDSFYRAGALVFGGGHVVLPLLQAEVVPSVWIGNDAFLAGYGAAQAVPGPLFTFAAYLGAAILGWIGAVLALVAIFLPAFLLVVGALPWWAQLRANTAAQSALAGVNAGVVGLLAAALYDPVWVSAIHSVADFVLALVALAALMVLRVSPWIVVLVFSGVGAVLYRLL